MAFTLNQISPAGAAEIIGFDCGAPASPADFAALQHGDAVRVTVDAGDHMAEIGETGARDKADIA